MVIFCDGKHTFIRALVKIFPYVLQFQFTRISYGYSWVPVNDVVSQYGSILRSLPGHPGAATVPLHHTLDILSYLRSPVVQRKDRQLSAEPLLRIYDMLLKYPDGFLDEQVCQIDLPYKLFLKKYLNKIGIGGRKVRKLYFCCRNIKKIK